MNVTLKRLTLLIIRGHSGGGDDSVVLGIVPPPTPPRISAPASTSLERTCRKTVLTTTTTLLPVSFAKQLPVFPHASCCPPSLCYGILGASVYLLTPRGQGVKQNRSQCSAHTFGTAGCGGDGGGGAAFRHINRDWSACSFHPSLSLNDTLQLMGRAQLGDRLGCFMAWSSEFGSCVTCLCSHFTRETDTPDNSQHGRMWGATCSPSFFFCFKQKLMLPQPFFLHFFCKLCPSANAAALI